MLCMIVHGFHNGSRRNLLSHRYLRDFFYLCKNNHITVIMALEIKAIPTLKGKEAERFVKEADKAYKNKEKTDFSKQVKIARAILKKANML